MYIKLTKIEISVLLLHMKITRKNVKKGFKSTYGSKDGKDLIKQYDTITLLLNNSLDELEEGEAEQFNFSEQEFNLVDSFLTWYVTKIAETFEAARKNVSGEDKDHLDTLQSINEKISLVKTSYA